MHGYEPPKMSILVLFSLVDWGFKLFFNVIMFNFTVQKIPFE